MNKVIISHVQNKHLQGDQDLESFGCSEDSRFKRIKQNLLDLAVSMQSFVDHQLRSIMPFIVAESGLTIAKGHRCPCKVYLLSPRSLEQAYKRQVHDPNVFYSVEFQAQVLAESMLNRMLQSSDPRVNDIESTLAHLNSHFLHEMDLLRAKDTCILDDYEQLAERLDSPCTLEFDELDWSDELNIELPDELLKIKNNLGSYLHTSRDQSTGGHHRIAAIFEFISDLIHCEEQEFQSESGERVIDPLGVYKSRRNYSRSIDSKVILKQAKPSIELYAVKIALCAESLQTSLIGLTNKVLVHELSHWNTHLGLDSDLLTWLEFHNADRLSIESSAQDLTLRSLERMASTYFSHKPVRRRLAVLSLLAFYQLNLSQSTPYRIHREWLHYSKAVRRQAFQIMRGINCQQQDLIHTFEYILQSIADVKSSSVTDIDHIPF